jgi:WD40 repeat protein
VCGKSPRKERTVVSLQKRWQCLESELERSLFLLASFFPAKTPIPLWLLGLATGEGEALSEHLSRAIHHLQALKLLNGMGGEQVQINARPRQFGQQLLESEALQSAVLIAEATQRLFSACWTLDSLKQRALRAGYSGCQGQLRSIRDFLNRLGSTESGQLIEQLEDWFRLETPLLAYRAWFPENLPDLFCQQLYNRSVEADRPFIMQKPPVRWLRLTRKVSGIDPSLEEQDAMTRFQDEVVGDRKVGRGQRDLHKHVLPGIIRCMAFSPDGHLLLTTGQDMSLWLWEVESGRQLRQLQGQTGRVECVAFSPDGKLAFTGGIDGIARLWEVESGDELLHWKAHTSPIEGVAFSPDGRLILTHGGSMARFWRVESGRELAWLSCVTGAGTGIAFSPDGQRVLIGGESWIWLSSLRIGWRRRLKGQTGAVTCVAFSPDEHLALTEGAILTPAEGVRRIVQIWDIKSRRQIFQKEVTRRWITDLAFSPDGRFFSVCESGKLIYFYQAQGPDVGKLLSIFFVTYETGALYWHQDNRLIVADKGGPTWRPHFYHLTLEGDWNLSPVGGLVRR